LMPFQVLKFEVPSALETLLWLTASNEWCVGDLFPVQMSVMRISSHGRLFSPQKLYWVASMFSMHCRCGLLINGFLLPLSIGVYYSMGCPCCTAAHDHYV
jgi:hypothetical protein